MYVSIYIIPKVNYYSKFTEFEKQNEKQKVAFELEFKKSFL